MKKKEVPIIFCVYNRPDLTKITFNFIKSTKPKILFLISDGPKNLFDLKKIKEVRSIISNINWDCKVYKKFRKVNFGCKKSFEDGVNWLFSKYDKMIYIEDDTLPSIDFIRFAKENLERHENNLNISVVSAQFEFSRYIKKKNTSYILSPLMRLQPFATWRRVWRLYEKDVSKIWYDNIFKIKTINKFNNFLYYIYFSLLFNWASIKALDSWDFNFYCSLICKLDRHPLAIIPLKNLSKNIGVNHFLATHSLNKSIKDFYAKIKTESLKKIIHPKLIKNSKKIDNLVFYSSFFPKRKNLFTMDIFLLCLRYVHSFIKIFMYNFFNKNYLKKINLI
jgi:hypothetical protein